MARESGVEFEGVALLAAAGSISSGINIVGHISARMGLGTTAREYAKALLDVGVPVAMYELPTGGGRSGADTTFNHLCVPTAEDLPHPLTVWIVGAGTLPTIAKQLLQSEGIRAKFNAAFLWWELPDVPPLHVAAARAFDAIVTGSEFVREAWAMATPGAPVLLAPHPLEIPHAVVAERERYGLRADQMVFFTGFEPASDPARKNPFAAVDAFKRAFPNDDSVRLVLKINNAAAAPHAQSLMDQLDRLIRNDERVVKVMDHLSHPELLALYACADAMVSLHRAEGLGLVPLEGMRLGVPAIATGWSGNMTYMTHDGAALVRYRMTETDESSAHYAPRHIGVHSQWADPDVDHAAWWMRRLKEDLTLRSRLSGNARRDALSYDAWARELNFISELGALAALPVPRRGCDSNEILRGIKLAEMEQRYFGLNPTRRVVTRVMDSVRWRLHTTTRGGA